MIHILSLAGVTVVHNFIQANSFPAIHERRKLVLLATVFGSRFRDDSGRRELKSGTEVEGRETKRTERGKAMERFEPFWEPSLRF